MSLSARTAGVDDYVVISDKNRTLYTIKADSERGCLVILRGGEVIATFGEAVVEAGAESEAPKRTRKSQPAEADAELDKE